MSERPGLADEPGAAGGWRGRVSRVAGRWAEAPVSRGLIPWFIHHYRVDMREALVPEGGFGTMQEFFTRGLRAGARPIAADPGVLVSPVDGRVGACGRIEQQQLLQAKGRVYSLAQLLGGAPAAAALEGGSFATLYLAPRDYHRVHAPCEARVTYTRYLPGRFHPVHPRAVSRVANLFAENERMVIGLHSPAGMVAVVMVGALLVAGIRLACAPGEVMERGAELGRFSFGSTVIVLAPAGVAAGVAVEPGARIRMGELLMTAAAEAL